MAFGNPLLDGLQAWTKPRSNMLLGLGAGFLSGDLGKAPLYAMKGKEADDAYATSQKAEAERVAQINQTAVWLQKNYPQFADLPPAEGFALATKLIGQQQGGAQPTTDIQNYEYAQAHPGFTDYQTQKGGAAEMSLTPTYGLDQDPKSPTFGQTVIGQLGKDGRFHKTDMGGIQPLNPYELAAQKAGGGVDAKTAANARAALPGAEQTANITLKAVDAILADTQGQAENFGNTFGVPNQMTWTTPGSAKANFWNNVQQAQGGAFLQARSWLKGQGAITEMESAKAEGAMSQMEMAAKTGNQEAFVQAVQQFRQAVLEGVEKIKSTASGANAAGQVPGSPAAAAPGGQTSGGVSWSVEP